MNDSPAALVDTDAFSLLFVRLGASDPRIARWLELLTGRRILISFQTRSEVLAGAMADGWGARRVIALRQILDRTPTVVVDNAVIDTHAELYAECRRLGHALHGKAHTGDRWVAACAITKSLPLLAGDGIYLGAPLLDLMS